MMNTNRRDGRVRIFQALFGCLLALALPPAGFGQAPAPQPPAPKPPEVAVSDLSLEGAIEGENISFTLTFKVESLQRNASLPLIVGDVAYLEGRLPSGAELVREGDQYILKLKRSGWFGGRRQAVMCRFASRAAKDGDWRHTTFAIPASSIRKLAVLCDRDDLEIKFPGALEVQRGKNKDGKAQVTAFLGVAGQFEVAWKPEVRRLDSELVLTCDANTVATASVGALRVDTLFTYRIIQGSLTKLSLVLPELNVTQVQGEDIQDWRIDRTDPAKPRVLVTLSRPREDTYRLRVEGEMVLSQFPCKFNLPALVPEQVLRTSGFVMIGTDSAIRLQVGKAGGLTQVDAAAFPAASVDGKAPLKRAMPARSAFAYQYANMPYVLALSADDIVTAFTVEDLMVLTLSDNELALDASLQIDIKDAPARELTIETDPDPGWTVTSVTGQGVSEPDTDVRLEPVDKPTRLIITVPFKQAMTGMALVQVRMEKTLAAGAPSFAAPRFQVVGAKSERGYLILAAEKGLRLKVDKAEGLREVHTGSAPMQVQEAQQAFRFKDPAWSLTAGIDRTPPSIHSEVFHLASVGEGVTYSSAAITYHIGGAPVQEFRIKVPAAIENIEFTGADIEGWKRAGDVCTVRLQAKVMGDYTLLLTWDRQFNFLDGADMAVGEVETQGTDSEVGYIAIASSASVSLKEADVLPASMIPIDRREIPAAYSAPINDPIIGSYKYVRAPHAAKIRVQPYRTEQLLRQVADFVQVSTAISKDGEAVTTATYSIKNASQQYLVVRLPEGVTLWSIKYVDEQGRKEAVLSQKSAEGLLVPVSRPRDPNTALRVEVVFAQSLGKLGFWRSGIWGLKLAAPALPDAHATFANWHVEVPARHSISGVKGNVESTLDAVFGGFGGVVRKTGRLARAVLDGWGGYTLRRALSGAINGNPYAEFTRSVNLSGSEPLSLMLFVVPGWMGAASSARGLAGVLLAGLVVVVVGLWRGRRGCQALGWTLLVFALTYSAAGRSALAVVLALAILGLVVRWLWRGGLRGIGRLVKAAVGGCFHVLARPFHRRAAPAGAADEEIPPFEPDDQAVEGYGAKGEGGKEGAVTPRMLMLTLAVGLGLGAGAGLAAPGPVLDSLRISVEGPGTGKDIEQSAKVTAVLEFSVDDPVSFTVLPATAVLTSCEPESGDLVVRSGKEGYTLDVRAAGRHRLTLQYRVPVLAKEGQWRVSVPMLPNMINQVAVKLPEAGLDIQSDTAVLLKIRDAKDATEAEAVFGPVGSAEFWWKPRIRTTTLEQVVFFSEANTFVSLQAGVVELVNLVRYQIAQGELRELKLKIPAGMSVTAVRAGNLATWSFDPEKRLLDAILEKPVSGDFLLTVVTQIAAEGLPYQATLGVVQVVDSARQRGSLAIAAPDTVQVRIDETKGLSPVNIEDFSAEAVAAAGTEGGRMRGVSTIRRAYRYHQPESVSVRVQTDKVLPEVRVTETGALSIADERIVLATRIQLAMAKAGIFSAELGIPADFEVETLTGPDVSHWDEVKENGRGVIVFFSRQVTDATEIHLVVGRTEKGIEAKVTVPRITVKDVAKHTGRLTVSGEKGVRLMVDEHTGVDIRKASEEGIRQAGVLVFDILNPAWSLVLRTDVLAPQVKPEVLQLVDLTEGMLQCRAYFRYKIENAGVKTFRIKAPAPGVAMTVTGRHIARVTETDKEKGIWQVDLQNKVEDLFGMTASYQVPYDPKSGGVKILPLQTLDTEEQRGYVVVTCSGRVQVEPKGDLNGLKAEDPRNIPAVFGAGDLSAAIQSYRAVRPDYVLELSVVRHDEAKVLPASVRQVDLTSTVSLSGRLLTRAVVKLTVGNLRFLKMGLPKDSDTLWTVTVNGKEVSTSRDGDLYCIPLEEQGGEQVTAVDLIYAGEVPRRSWFGRTTFEAPRFVGLPLREIGWTFYVPTGLRYHGFGGTLEYQEESGGHEIVFSDEQYQEDNRSQKEQNLKLARQGLDTGEQFMKAGKTSIAKKALQQALNYSAADESLNEDARVQLRNLQKQQVKLGLVSRRGAVRYAKNLADEQSVQQMQALEGGEFTQEVASQVERGLSQKDKDALEVVANKMLEQQAAAAGVVTAIHVTMPEHGKILRFHRALQIDPQGDLTVSFRTNAGRVSGVLRAIWPALLLFGFVWYWLGRSPAPAA